MYPFVSHVRRPLLLAAAAILFQTTSAQAQTEDAQVWTSAAVSMPLTDSLSATGGLYVRASDTREGIYQLHFVGDLEQEFGDVTLSVGYSHIPNYESGAVVTSENRVRQQAAFPLARIGAGRLTGRVRLEQRWRDDGEDLKLRLRPAITFALPIGPKDLSLRLGHESFVNLNDTDWGPPAGYDRMRNNVSLRRAIAPRLTGEIGYLNQYIFGRDEPDEVDHVLTLGLVYGF